eukprot:CAMPEP_0117484034 /NCGR_PEP_ID=MMETSP0784-20121206/14254_1 /TAXON_ID=39447 /ORGANISM="" /LENGTH=124 /DNA_ID=CAMNT_0005278603 /DNA_START=334 /DNA_END=709 /DNA_ORIENTATION=+
MKVFIDGDLGQECPPLPFLFLPLRRPQFRVVLVAKLAEVPVYARLAPVLLEVLEPVFVGTDPASRFHVLCAAQASPPHHPAAQHLPQAHDDVHGLSSVAAQACPGARKSTSTLLSALIPSELTD